MIEQQIPPPPPGFEIIGGSGGGSVPPPPPGFAVTTGAAPSGPASNSRPRNGPAPFPGDPEQVITGLVPGVRITSRQRTQAQQQALIRQWEQGGRRGVRPANNSNHLTGKAFDLAPAPGQSMAQLEAQLRQSGLPFAELINEGDHVHVAWGDVANAETPGGLSDERLAELSGPVEPVGGERGGFNSAPPDVVIDNAITTDNGTVYTLDADRVRTPIASEAQWNAMSPEQQDALFQSVAKGRTAGAEAARSSARENGVGEADWFSSLTAPINDEVGFAAGYGLQGLENLRRQVMGEDIESSALEGARAYRGVTQENQEAFDAEHPGQSISAGILGGLAFAPAKGAQLPGLLGRLGQAGGVSSAYGVAEGDGVGGRVGGGILNGALGVATAGTFEAVPALARAGSRAVARATAPAGTVPTRQESRVGSALERAMTRDGTDAASLLANLDDAAPGQLPFEAGGENLQGLAEVMANSPGRARVSLLDAVGARRDQASNRVSGVLSDSFGAEGNGFQAIRSRIKARGDEAEAGMAAIADRVVPLDSQSVQAVRSGLSAKAVRDAAQEALADLSPEGSAAANRLFGLADEALDNPAGAAMTVREAQDISYALKEAADRAYRGGFNSRGEALSNLSRTIRGNARRTVGEYDQWLTNFGDASEAIGAMRTGQNIFARANERNSMSAAQLREQWDGWSDAAKESYRLGVGEAIIDRVRSNGGVTAMRRLVRDNELSDRVRIAFGSEDAFARFMQTADDEVRMANVDNSILGGSPTARRAAGRSDLENQGLGPLEIAESAIDLTNPITALRLGAKQLVRTLPRQDRSIVGNDEMNALLGEALSSPDAMRRLLTLLESQRGLLSRADSRVGAAGLLTAPGAPAATQDRGRGVLTANP